METRNLPEDHTIQ